MTARVSEAVAVRDDEAGIELRVSALAPSKDGGVRIEVRVLGKGDPYGPPGSPGLRTDCTYTLDLSADVARDLRGGLTRALKASGAGE